MILKSQFLSTAQLKLTVVETTGASGCNTSVFTKILFFSLFSPQLDDTTIPLEFACMATWPNPLHDSTQ